MRKKQRRENEKLKQNPTPQKISQFCPKNKELKVILEEQRISK